MSWSLLNFVWQRSCTLHAQPIIFYAHVHACSPSYTDKTWETLLSISKQYVFGLLFIILIGLIKDCCLYLKWNFKFFWSVLPLNKTRVFKIFKPKRGWFYFQTHCILLARQQSIINLCKFSIEAVFWSCLMQDEPCCSANLLHLRIIQRFFFKNRFAVGKILAKSMMHKRVVRKIRPHKIAKNWPHLPCPCGHTINFENSEVFCIKKCGLPHLKNPLTPCLQNVRTEQTLPLWLRTSFMDSLEY